MTDAERRSELGQQFRVDSIRMSAEAKSGHPTSAMSAADLMAVLVDGYLRYDFDSPKSPANDRLIFSKGHASTLLYSIYLAAGVISDDELLSYRTFGSKLEGHPTPVLPWVDVATGSLGQGLPIGVGTALAAKYLDRVPARTWVLCGDSEMAEGSIWEAFEHAAHYSLDNLTAILDANRLGQRGETMVGRDLDVYVERAHAFGWHAIAIDGHDVAEIDRAYAQVLETTGKPTLVVARTVKGKGVAAVEDVNGFHGKPLDDPDEAIEELGGLRQIRVEVAKPEAGDPHRFPTQKLELPRYEVGIGDRDAQGLRGGTRRARKRTWRHRRARRRGLQLDVRGDLRRRTIPTASSRCTSPSSRWSLRRSASRSSVGARSRRPSPRFSRGPTTSSAWRR